MKVYIVTYEWAGNYDNGVEHYAFDTYEKAKACFDEKVEFEKTEVWEEAFDDNGNIIDDDDYEMEENDKYFEIWESGYYEGSHTLITITEQEVM